jgi:hypothetical protein
MPSPEIEERARATLEDQLKGVYTQRPIKDPARFSGRQELLEKCRSSVRATDMAAYAVYGERGIGKNSFVNVWLADRPVQTRTAEAEMDFAALFAPVLESLGENLVVTELLRGQSQVSSLEARIPHAPLGLRTEAGSTRSETRAPITPATIDYDRLADALGRHTNDVVVIDEFHRLALGVKLQVVQLIKRLANRDDAPLVVIIGTTDWNKDLLGDPEAAKYVRRHIEPVALPRLSPAELRDIIDKRKAFGVNITDDVATNLIWVANGYPALIHRVVTIAAIRWIATHAAELVTRLMEGFFAIAKFAWALTRAAKHAKLSEAGVVVGQAELEVALRQDVAGFETAIADGHGYDEAATDPEAKALLDAYALSEDEAFDLDALAQRTQLSVSAARRAFNRRCSQIVRVGDDLVSRPGVKSYLRAKLVLRGDPRIPVPG